MTRNAAAEEIRLLPGSITFYALMIALSPIFLILALFYVLIHPNRAGDGKESHPVGELVISQ